MDLIAQFIEKAKAAPKRIVFPEGADERIVQAAARVAAEGIASPILLGARDQVEQAAADAGVPLEGIEIVNPKESDLLERFAADYSSSRDLKEAIAAKVVRKPLSFGGMMVKLGHADGMVAGVANATTSVIQAATLTIGYAPGTTSSSSFFIMLVPGPDGAERPFVFADCAVAVKPTPEQLAHIGVAAGTNAQALLGIEPRVAFLSFSTKGSANHDDVDAVVRAVETAKGLAPGMAIDGELQGDAAIAARVAAKKAPDSAVAGQANVLVFPDLNAANIAYKLVQYLAGATAIGPVMQGFAKPVNDMSRGASVDDVVGVTAITVVQAG